MAELIFVLFCIAVDIALAVYVWRDASKRRDPNRVLWVFAVLCSGLLAAFLYVMLGRRHGGLRQCPNCEKDTPVGLPGCVHCRKRFRRPLKTDRLARFLEDPDEEPILATGAKLGPYRIEEFVGRGGMGSVYRARDASGGAVALKVLPRALARDPEFIERFRREAQILAKLRHPNIAEIRDSGREGDVYYLAMEFVEGTTLRSAMKTGLARDQALDLIPKLCDALEYAHANGVVHRDIKPENVLLAADGEPKIADFGLARIAGTGAALTRTVAVMGTPDYMAPEQRRSTREADPRADVFSLGVVIYEMLAGHLPVGRFEPPTGDDRIDAIVLRSLEYDRERRYARAGEMGADLRGTAVS